MYKGTHVSMDDLERANSVLTEQGRGPSRAGDRVYIPGRLPSTWDPKHRGQGKVLLRTRAP